jgi:hypothetical protein
VSLWKYGVLGTIICKYPVCFLLQIEEEIAEKNITAVSAPIEFKIINRRFWKIKT